MLDNKEKMTTESGRDAREILHKFIQTNRLHRRVIERYADSLDLHCSEHRMLLIISKSEDNPSQKELAECLKISPAAVANTIKKLESGGYVERSKPKSGGDSRQNMITITERGTSAVKESEKYFRYVDSSALSGFTDAELDTFVALLDKMQNNLNNIEDIDVIATPGKEEKQ